MKTVIYFDEKLTKYPMPFLLNLGPSFLNGILCDHDHFHDINRYICM